MSLSNREILARLIQCEAGGEDSGAGAGYYSDGGGFCESGFDGFDGCGEAGGAA